MGNKSVFDVVHLFISEFYSLSLDCICWICLACDAHSCMYSDGVIVLFSSFSMLKDHLKTTYAGMQSGK
jgi:hypothetical protein